MTLSTVRHHVVIGSGVAGNQAAETLRLPVATYRQYEQGRRPLPAVVGLAAELLHAAFVRRA